MPIPIPPVDDRRYEDLLAEAVARIPVHTPEWTNFTRGDPGMTLLELFAFLTETTIYRANLIPERNRLAFLSLLGVPLQPAQPARGLVVIANERGPLETLTLSEGVEVRAGAVPFRGDVGLDVLPVEGRVYYKQPVVVTPDLQAQYQALYATYLVRGAAAPPLSGITAYRTAVLDGTAPGGVDLGDPGAVVDGCLWLALLARANEPPEQARAAIAGRVLSLGVVPVVEVDETAHVPVAGGDPGAVGAHLSFWLPTASPLPVQASERQASYAPLTPAEDVDVLAGPGVVQLPLPASGPALASWADLEPLEEGVGAFPPLLDDDRLAARLVTWVRIAVQGQGPARVLWAGVNALPVTQRVRVVGEVLAAGTGAPDQRVRLARAPVLAGSVRLRVGPVDAATQWHEVARLAEADPEVRGVDPRLPAGSVPAPGRRGLDGALAFAVDAEAGVLQFGDGRHGRRPRARERLCADYDYTLGAAGVVASGAVTGASALPPGFTVSNPVRTWAGADAETVADGVRQVSRYLQHRDRLVTAEDFEVITRRTPGVDLARVEVLPAFAPQPPAAADRQSGTGRDAPGAVTVMVVPRRDPAAPDAPAPDRFTRRAICRYLEPRRLVTTELFVRGPAYVGLWVSVGLEVRPGYGVADVRAKVAALLRQVLSPLPLAAQAHDEGIAYPHAPTGWPLETPVTAAELSAYANRVDGVRFVRGLLLAAADGVVQDTVDLTGLCLPRVLGLCVAVDAPVPIGTVQGGAAQPAAPGPAVLPVPVLAEGC